jgi:hypothetical protein
MLPLTIIWLVGLTFLTSSLISKSLFYEVRRMAIVVKCEKDFFAEEVLS